MSTNTLEQPLFAEQMDDFARRARKAQQMLVLGHCEAFDELGEVYGECSHPDWDGYDALPVEQETLRYAYQLIESMRLGFPRPSIGAEPDGALTLEWHHSPRRTLSVSVTADGYLHYSALFGANHVNGTIVFFGEIPEEIETLVSRVVGP